MCHQLTGCETVGNIQIQVIPSFRHLPNIWAGYSATATPRELGFSPGGCIRYKLPTLSAAKGRGVWHLFIRTLHSGTMTVKVEGDPTVDELKRLFQEIEGSPAEDQRLIFNGKQLWDSLYLRQNYGITTETTIAQVIRTRGGGDPVFPMVSLGAGGSIKQTIIQDETHHRMWDVDSAKTYHLQVVNSAHFEELTGVMAPDTPITIQEYASSGFPFFDIYNETPNSIYGNFGGLKALAELDSILQAKLSDNWSSEPHALNKCQCDLNLLDCMYVQYI